jgi:hypothetical protein
MNLTRCLVVLTAAVALLASGCGGDDDNNKDTTGAGQPAQQQQQPQQQAPAADAPGGEDAVKETILKWTFEGDCELMTDKFLEEQAFIGDNRQERCDYFEKSFQKPQYKESDVKFRKVTVTGDSAVAVVGSDIANVESEYKLVAEGGEWKIDEAGIS